MLLKKHCHDQCLIAAMSEKLPIPTMPVRLRYMYNVKQESCDIAKMTAQCPHATYTWMPWNFRDSLTTPIATIPNISMGFCSDRSYECSYKIWSPYSFTRSWDNRGYPKNLDTPWIRPRSLFSKIFNGLLFGLALQMYPPNLKSALYLFLR